MHGTVLIVDDHPSFRATARMLLEGEGWTSSARRRTATPALREARRLRPALVLLDVNLPDIDGFDVAARLTAERRRPPAVVLVLEPRRGATSAPMVERSRRTRVRLEGRPERRRAAGARRVTGLRRARSCSSGCSARSSSRSASRSRSRATTSRSPASRRRSARWSWRATSAVGLYAWWRRPSNRVGMLMTAVGFAAFFQALCGRRTRRCSSRSASRSAALYIVVAVHMLLAFPSGPHPDAAPAQPRHRRATPSRRSGPLLFLAHQPGLPVPGRASGQRAAHQRPAGARGRHRRPDVARRHRARSSPSRSCSSAAGAHAGPRDRSALGAGAVDRRGDGRAARASSLAFDAVVAESDVVDAVEPRRARGVRRAAVRVPRGPACAAAAWRAGAVVDLVERLGTAPARGELRDALAEALGDPSLADRVLDRGVAATTSTRTAASSTCPPRTIPTARRRRSSARGARVGALVHDKALGDEPELVASVARRGRAGARQRAPRRRAARPRRGAARARASACSRPACPSAGDSSATCTTARSSGSCRSRCSSAWSRQQLERDPEAAARAARRRARPRRARRSRTCASSPAASTRRCSPTAAWARRSRRSPTARRCRSRSSRVPPQRLPAAVEAAAYFVVAESLTNVAKYAQASHAEVQRAHARTAGRWSRSRDDGVGGADPARGTGLRGLADRLAALDGRLEIESAPGRGTTIRARVPCMTRVHA